MPDHKKLTVMWEEIERYTYPEELRKEFDENKRLSEYATKILSHVHGAPFKTLDKTPNQ